MSTPLYNPDYPLADRIKFLQSLVNPDEPLESETWNCVTCGCSDTWDIHGERICYCDSCHKGCESIESRIGRRAKRSLSWLKACIALRVLEDECASLYACHDLERRAEVLALLWHMEFPEAFRPKISLARDIMENMRLCNTCDVYTICENLLSQLRIFSETGEIHSFPKKFMPVVLYYTARLI